VHDAIHLPVTGGVVLEESPVAAVEFEMRVLLIVLALIVVFALVGWITFSDDDGRASINLETDEIREDTGEVMNKGSELLKDAEQEVAPDGETRDEETSQPVTP
jgi:hypothetical protein